MANLVTIIQGRLRKLGKKVPEAATSKHLAATPEARSADTDCRSGCQRRRKTWKSKTLIARALLALNQETEIERPNGSI